MKIYLYMLKNIIENLIDFVLKNNILYKKKENKSILK